MHELSISTSKQSSYKGQFKRGVLSQSLTYCVVGCNGEESASHLFFECPVFASIWYAICKWIGVSSVLHNEGMISSINWLD